MYKLKEDSNGLQCFWRIISITVFQSSSLLFVTFDLMLGTQTDSYIMFTTKESKTILYHCKTKEKGSGLLK